MIEHIGSIALDVAGAAGHNFSQVVLGEYLHGKVVVEDVDILVSLHRLDERLLDLVAGVVGMMQDAELAVPALAMEVEVAFLIFVEVYAPVYQGFNLFGCLCYNLFHGFWVAEPVAGNHGVVDVLLKVVDFEICNAGNAALSQVGVGLVERTLAHESHLAGIGNFQGKTHACHARSYNEIIIFVSHNGFVMCVLC